MGFFLGSKPAFSYVKSQSELRWGKMGMKNVFFCNDGISTLNLIVIEVKMESQKTAHGTLEVAEKA